LRRLLAQDPLESVVLDDREVLEQPGDRRFRGNQALLRLFS
jgi:hypothetical protein